MIHRIAALAGLLSLAPLFATTPAVADLYKEVRDWTVTCTNGLTCTLAFSKAQADGSYSGLSTISFQRTSQPNAPVELVLPVVEGYDKTADPAGRFAFAVDGKEVLSQAVPAMTADPNGYQLRTADRAGIDGLVAAMRAGKSMSITYTAPAVPGGRQVLDVSLSGFTAGLLYTDEAQDRLKRPDALVDKGDRPVPERAATREIARFADIPEAIRGDFTRDDAACGGLEEARLSDLGAFETEIADEQTLIVLPCGVGGAYNQPYAFYAQAYGRIWPLGLPVIGESGPTVETDVYNIGYDSGTKTVTSFFKGRGIGDCGTYAVWTIADAGQGPAFTLKEQREKGDCDGDPAGGPEKWPRQWPPAGK